MTFEQLKIKLYDTAVAGEYTSTNVSNLTYQQVFNILGVDGEGVSGGAVNNLKHSVMIMLDAEERQAKVDEVVAIVRAIRPAYANVVGRLKRRKGILELKLQGPWEDGE